MNKSGSEKRKHIFSELVEVEKVRNLTDLFYRATGMPSSVIGLDGEIITGSGWQHICKDFHRVNPHTRDRCIECDTVIANRIESERKYTVYRCSNGLIDAATPIFIEGEHVANLFTGQFLFGPPDLDFFREQARQFGFDEGEYLDAAARIPVIDEKKLLPYLNYLVALAEMLGDAGIRQNRQREVEQALRESREDLKRAQSVAHTGSWRLDVHKDELLWSEEAYRIFGIPEGTPLSYEIFLDAVHPDDREYVDGKWKAALRGDSYDIDHRIVAGSTVKWVREQAELEFDGSGELLGGFGAVQDITSRKQAEDELNTYREQLEELVKDRTAELQEKNRKLKEEIIERKKAEEEKRKAEVKLVQTQKIEALGRLSGGIAHDMNNALYPMIINTEMLLEDTEPGTDLHEMLEQILNASYRQRDLVKQILSFGRQDNPKISRIMIAALLDETLNLLRSTLPSTIEIRLDNDAQADSIMGDPSQIQQVIVNLCKNAADALESQRGTIEVSLSHGNLEPAPSNPEIKAGEYFQLKVRDTGLGMPPDVMDRIFEPFYTTKDVGKGSGMGLSVVHGILEKHGGTITVESEEGKGSVFTVYLPVYDEGTHLQASADESKPAEKGREKILLVDDEDIILSSLQRALQKAGYRVVAVKDSVEAFKLFSKAPDAFDLVITDLTMPKMTGLELGKKLMQMRPAVPVILCTGFSDIVSQEEINTMGFKVLLQKPSGTEELKEAVRVALDG